MAYINAIQAADYILFCANDAQELITNLKLNKLLYYAQGYHIAIHDDLLFEDEIQAWVHGPVVPNVYHKYKGFKWAPINVNASRPELSKEVFEFLDVIIETFLPIDAYKLELMTHEEKPWKNARSGLPKDALCQNTIEPTDMKEYFTLLMS